jgi:hypothetical protein
VRPAKLTGPEPLERMVKSSIAFALRQITTLKRDSAGVAQKR